MITREQAAEYVRLIDASHGPRDRRLDDARTIVALHDENATILANAQRITSLYAEERDAARAEVATLTNLLRLAEASVSLLRADLAASELRERRLRAAEAPGTDDEAVAPWESVGDEDRPIWRYWWTPRLAVLVSRRPHGWAWFDGASWSDRGYIFAVDAMLAAERATASP